MELSFHLVAVSLPHLSPTFKIYIYRAGNPAQARLTGSRWLLSRHTSRGPHPARAQATRCGKHSQHPNFHFSPFNLPLQSPMLHNPTFSEVRIHQTEVYFCLLAQGAAQPLSTALRDEKTADFSVPSSFAVRLSAVSLPAVDWAVRAPT